VQKEREQHRLDTECRECGARYDPAHGVAVIQRAECRLRRLTDGGEQEKNTGHEREAAGNKSGFKSNDFKKSFQLRIRGQQLSLDREGLCEQSDFLRDRPRHQLLFAMASSGRRRQAAPGEKKLSSEAGLVRIARRMFRLVCLAMTRHSHAAFLAFSFVFLLAALPAFSQGKPAEEKRGSIVIAPIPVSSPAVGSGLVLVSGYVFKLSTNDSLSPPSFLGAVGAGTNNGSRGVLFGGRLYFAENKYQTTLLMAKGHVNYDFFGIGRVPARESASVPLQTGGTILFGEFLRNVGKNVFVGGRYQYRRLFSRIENDASSPADPGGFEVPEIDLQASSAALGLHLQRDTRDSTFYPTKGTFFNGIGDFFDQAWGSRREYQTYKLSFSGYREVATRQVVAYQVLGCSSNGNPPFYDLCLYGVNNQLRGYTGGEFQDRRMFTTQGEYRLELPKRLGLVAFAGIGGVAEAWGDLNSDRLLPSVGAGLRFKLDKKNHINYRVDFAYGREGHTLSIGVGEAF
jgi:hypothetical protein